MQQKIILLKKAASDELVKKGNAVDSDKQNLKKNIEYVDKKILDTNKFIATKEFNRLTKINFNAKMAEAWKKLATNK